MCVFPLKFSRIDDENIHQEGFKQNISLKRTAQKSQLGEGDFQGVSGIYLLPKFLEK